MFSWNLTSVESEREKYRKTELLFILPEIQIVENIKEIKVRSTFKLL